MSNEISEFYLYLFIVQSKKQNIKWNTGELQTACWGILLILHRG